MNKLSRATVVGIALTALVLAVATVGFFLLPDTLIAQVGFNGQIQSYMPKPLLLALPVGISILGVGISFQEGKRTSAVLMPIIALGVLVFAFVVNR